MKKIVRNINVEIKATEQPHTYTFIASTDSVDRMGDVIEQSGWNLENFLKNPVIPWGHDYSLPPIGRSVNTRVEDGKLMIDVEFASEIYGFAALIEDLVKHGFLKSTSVGFRPIKEEPLKDSRGTRFIEQELLEVSIVTVPANQDALAQMSAKGINIKSLEEKGFIEIIENEVRPMLVDKSFKTIEKEEENQEEDTQEEDNQEEEETKLDVAILEVGNIIMGIVEGSEEMGAFVLDSIEEATNPDTEETYTAYFCTQLEKIEGTENQWKRTETTFSFTAEMLADFNLVEGQEIVEDEEEEDQEEGEESTEDSDSEEDSIELELEGDNDESKKLDKTDKKADNNKKDFESYNKAITKQYRKWFVHFREKLELPELSNEEKSINQVFELIDNHLANYFSETQKGQENPVLFEIED